MGQSISGAITTVAEDATSITKRLVITYYSSVAGIYDGPTNEFDVSLDFPNRSGGVMLDTRPNPDTHYDVIYDETQVFSKAYGTVQTRGFAASLSGISYWPGTIYTNGSTTVPARAYGAPAAPSDVAVSGSVDSSRVVTWTNNSTGDATTSAPYSSQNVLRSTDGGAFTTIATGLSGSDTSYTDPTTAADHSYAYKIVAVNATGSATSTASSTVYTTPAAPGTPSAAWSGSSIVLAFANSARVDAGVKIYESQNGGAFNLLATVATANLTSYTHSSPSTSVNHAYKVATYNGSLISTLSAASNTVYVAPAKVTGVTATRTSDTSHVVNWTTHATTAAPYASQSVQRWDNVTNAWATIKTGLSGSATSYTDPTTVANRQYKYRVVATNSTASATSDPSAATQTTPAAPTGATATKSGTSITVTWTRNASSGMTVGYEVWESLGDGTYALLATLGDVATYTPTSPSTSVTHQYKVRAKSTVGATTYSDYSETGVVQLAAPPNAPTGLTSTPAVSPASETVRLAYTHNPVDSSTQRKQQFRHRAVGGSTWTEVAAVVTAHQYLDLALSAWGYADGDSVEWQASTWGTATTGGRDGTGASDWSATAVVALSSRPTAAISSPGASVTTSILTVAFTYYDAEGSTQAEWQAQLKDSGGTVIETIGSADAASSGTFTTRVADATSYTVEVRVKDGAGLWSTWDAQAFSVSYLPSEKIDVAATYDADSGTVALTLTPQGVTSGVTVAAVSAVVQRSTNGGEWEAITDAIDPATTIVDTTNTTNGDISYRVVATSALPSSSTGDAVTVSARDAEWCYFYYGAGFGTGIKARGNPKLTVTPKRDVVIHDDLDGRTYPLAAFGTNRSNVIGMALTIEAGAVSTLEDWRTAALEAETGYWKDFTGRVWRAALSGLSTSEDNLIYGDVSLSVVKVSNV